MCAYRDLLGNNNPSPKMFPVLICTHSLQTSKCLLSINIFIRSSLLLPLVIYPDSKHSECQETPLTPSQQGIGFGKGHFQVPAGSQQLSLTAARDLAPSSRLLAWRLFLWKQAGRIRGHGSCSSAPWVFRPHPTLPCLQRGDEGFSQH